MSRNLLNWGVFFIVLGAIPLAVQAGLLETAVAQQLLRLWPLILIGIGIGLLLRFTPVAALGGVIVAATAGMLAGAVLAAGVTGFGDFAGFGAGCADTGTDAAGQVATQSGTFAGERVSVEMELTCVGLTVERRAGSEWSVEATHAEGRQPRIEPGTDSLRLASDTGRVFVPFADDSRRAWQVTLPQAATLSTSITLNASNARIDLGGGSMEALNGTFNASDARLDAGTATDLQSVGLTWNAASGTLSLPAASLAGSMTLNASSVTLCVPPDVGLRLDHQATLSSDNFDELGLTQTGGAWQTADYDAAAQRIQLRISSNVSSVELARAGGCP